MKGPAEAPERNIADKPQRPQNIRGLFCRQGPVISQMDQVMIKKGRFYIDRF